MDGIHWRAICVVSTRAFKMWSKLRMPDSMRESNGFSGEVRNRRHRKVICANNPVSDTTMSPKECVTRVFLHISSIALL
jgi:hypothetical protein